MFYLASRIIGSVIAFLYPGYASYKTLSQRPASEQELERWLMYWSVLGCLVAFEYVAEWLISWIPFYYLIKTIFLLYLSLPQTQGSTYIYIYHLQPFFFSHENQIDATLASLQARVYSFVQDRLRALWDQLIASLGQQPPSAPAATEPPPSLNNPLAGPVETIASLWRTYGLTVMTTGAALLKQTTAPPMPAAAPSYFREDSGQTVIDRRRQLEAELASLPQAGSSSIPMPVPMPAAVPQMNLQQNPDAYLRDRTTSVSFEKIDIPRGPQGYDVDNDEGVGHEYGGQPSASKRASWFGWGGSTDSGSSKSGYERVKEE